MPLGTTAMPRPSRSGNKRQRRQPQRFFPSQGARQGKRQVGTERQPAPVFDEQVNVIENDGCGDYHHRNSPYHQQILDDQHVLSPSQPRASSQPVFSPGTNSWGRWPAGAVRRLAAPARAVAARRCAAFFARPSTAITSSGSITRARMKVSSVTAITSVVTSTFSIATELEARPWPERMPLNRWELHERVGRGNVSARGQRVGRDTVQKRTYAYIVPPRQPPITNLYPRLTTLYAADPPSYRVRIYAGSA